LREDPYSGGATGKKGGKKDKFRSFWFDTAERKRKKILGRGRGISPNGGKENEKKGGGGGVKSGARGERGKREGGNHR